MDDPLIPGTPTSGQRSDDEGKEATCCSPVHSKLKGTSIQWFSAIDIVCGILSIGLGIVAVNMKCTYSNLCFPIISGYLLAVTGSIGMFVNEHVSRYVKMLLGCLCIGSFVCSFAVVLAMMIALPENEGTWQSVCVNHDCIDEKDEHCCYDFRLFMHWKNVPIDLTILVVSVVAMIASLLASTLCLHNIDWLSVCGCTRRAVFINFYEQTYQNVEQRPILSNSDQRVSSTTSGVQSNQQNARLKTCWTPCSSNGYMKTIGCFSVLHIVVGFMSVALGLAAVAVDSRFDHVGVPIWSGILIFCTTGIYGLLSIKFKGVYAPFFMVLSFLSLMFAINMFVFALASYDTAPHCYYGCTLHCDSTPSPACPNCLPGCCELGDICDTDAHNKQTLVDYVIIAVGVFESIISMVTFGLAFSQLTCYSCCNVCKCCCCDSINDQYRVDDGNRMAAPQPQTDAPN